VSESIRYWILGFAAGVVIFGFVGSSGAEDLAVRSCTDLVRMAETCQEDLKTVDTVLRSNPELQAQEGRNREETEIGDESYRPQGVRSFPLSPSSEGRPCQRSV
jgi:hypothetical protein